MKKLKISFGLFNAVMFIWVLVECNTPYPESASYSALMNGIAIMIPLILCAAGNIILGLTALLVKLVRKLKNTD